MSVNIKCIPPNEVKDYSVATAKTIEDCVMRLEDDHEIILPATTAKGVQDYLYRLNIDNKVRHLFAFALDKIVLSDTTLTVAHNAKRITSIGRITFKIQPFENL